LRALVAELAASLSADFRNLRTWLEVEGALLHFRPRPDAWTVEQILEHVTLTNRFLLLLIEKLQARARKRAERGEPLPQVAPRFDHVEALGRHSFRWLHPEHMTPTGGVSPAELRSRLERQERECLDALRRMPNGEGSLHRIRLSLLETDEHLDLYQYLYFLGVHMRRHRAQMERNRESWSQTDAAP